LLPSASIQDYGFVNLRISHLDISRRATMPDEINTESSLVSDRPSDSNLTVALHPLVLLTLSDHITRHKVRGYSGIIVGALLGQLKGRETTLEHAFECNVQPDERNQTSLQIDWFEARLQQCKSSQAVPE
jgi:COP9 signalosome complex subunit 6